MKKTIATTSPILRRIATGAGAYGYAQAVSVGTQLISIPIFLHYWDLNTYGYWLALTAVPFYLSLADVGISSASCNQMIRLIAKNEKLQAEVVFHSALAFLLSVSAIILIVVAISLVVLPDSLMQIPNWKSVLMLLSVSVVLSLFCGLAEVIYKSTGCYAGGTYLVTTGRLVEWSGGLIGLMVTHNYLGIASAALVSRLIYTLFSIWISHNKTDYLNWGLKNASLTVVKSAANSGLLFLSLSLTNALSLQGFTLLVTGTLGPAATAIFNTYRTISRIVVQIVNSISSPLWPELTALKNNQDDSAFWRLYRQANRIGITIGVTGAIFVYFASPYLLNAWTHGHIQFNDVTMAIFLIYAAVCSASQVSRVLLMSIDRHARLALSSLLSTVISLLIAGIFWRSTGLDGFASAMVLGEALVWLTATRQVVSIKFKNAKS